MALVVTVACGGDERSRATDSLPRDLPAELDTLPLDSLATPADSAPAQELDPGSAEAAVSVIHDYYAAIAGRDHERAYRYWSSEGEASGQTLAEFRDGFQDTESVRVEVGRPDRVDPAAGSRFIEIPVAVRARTTRGDAQCFRGTYTLRRAVIDGATAEQRRWRIAAADVRSRDASACAPGLPLGELAEDTVAAAVRAFGGRLASVSLLAPADIVRREMRSEYGPYVTPTLLAAWLEQPSGAPGRMGSSPWPQRIDVTEVERLDSGRYRALGDVIYITSAEATRGGAAHRQRVELEVVREDRWRIARYQLR